MAYLTQMTLRPAYLTKKLSYPLPTKDSSVLRTIRDAGDYLLALPPHRELRNHWQRARELILEEADIEAVTSQFHRALFMDGQLDLGAFERMMRRRRRQHGGDPAATGSSSKTSGDETGN
jgi:hypothetical protein